MYQLQHQPMKCVQMNVIQTITLMRYSVHCKLKIMVDNMNIIFINEFVDFVAALIIICLN